MSHERGLHCPTCSSRYTWRESLVGRKVRCKACQAVMRFPERADQPFEVITVGRTTTNRPSTDASTRHASTTSGDDFKLPMPSEFAVATEDSADAPAQPQAAQSDINDDELAFDDEELSVLHLEEGDEADAVELAEVDVYETADDDQGGAYEIALDENEPSAYTPPATAAAAAPPPGSTTPGTASRGGGGGQTHTPSR